MRQFRYVIKGIAYEWQDCKDVTVEKMEAVAERLTKWYGDDWDIEYRG